MKKGALRQKQAFFFDLDGCLYFTNRPADNASKLLDQLRIDGKHIGFITNNSRQAAGEISKKLTSMGIQAFPEEIFTATDAVGQYVLDQYGPVKVKAAGSDSLLKALMELGHAVYSIEDDETADVIIIGRDTEFHYSKLQAIVEDACQGAKILSANPDMYHPGARGERVPETGSLVASIEAVLSRKIDYIGKPASYLFEKAMSTNNCVPEQTVMIGDNLNTDIVGGNRAGMTTIWVHGGHIKELNKSSITPDYAVRDMAELLLKYYS